MHRAATWRSLVPGLVALATLLTVAVVTLLFARVGGLRGRTFRLYVAATEAPGVIRGSEVWLAGQRVGEVKGITFRSPDVALHSRVLIEVQVLESVRNLIRMDSHVELRNGGTVIGAPVVYISTGAEGAELVRNGDTVEIVTRPNVDSTALARFADASHELPAITNAVHLAVAQVSASSAALSAVVEGARGAGGPTLASRASSLMARMAQPSGTLGRARLDPGLVAARARQGIAQADSVRMLVAARAGDLTRLAQDSALPKAMQALQTNLAMLHATSLRTDGTVGRALAERPLRANVDSLRRSLAALFDDMKGHPFRYIQFF